MRRPELEALVPGERLTKKGRGRSGTSASTVRRHRLGVLVGSSPCRIGSGIRQRVFVVHVSNRPAAWPEAAAALSPSTPATRAIARTHPRFVCSCRLRPLGTRSDRRGVEEFRATAGNREHRRAVPKRHRCVRRRVWWGPAAGQSNQHENRTTAPRGQHHHQCPANVMRMSRAPLDFSGASAPFAGLARELFNRRRKLADRQLIQLHF
jgi:hypothetical protein